MAFGDNQSDFDYIISDVNGMRGVKDDKEYPIDDKKYRSWHKEHKDIGCTECSFVQDKETLFIYLVPRDLKDKVTNKPMFFGKFTMPGWTGHSGFYLFKCKACGEVSTDYPHGYTDYGLMFLCCDHCQETIPLEVTEERALYEREKVFIPKPTREERIKDFTDMIADVEEKGVRVIVAPSDKVHRPKVEFFQFLRDYFNS